MRRLYRLFTVALALSLFGLAQVAQAQNSMSLDVGVNGNGEPEVSWITTPEADTCTPTGVWSGTGDQGASGTATLDRITGTTVIGLDCSWSGDSLAELSWVNPTENTDGTTYDPSTGDTVIVWSQDDISNLSCYDADTANTTTRPGDQTMHTVTSLAPGDWNFAAYARNSMGVCSEISNVATKTIQGEVMVSDSVTIRMPGPIQNLEAS